LRLPLVRLISFDVHFHLRVRRGVTGYAHPLEQLVANLFPLFSGPVLMNSHFVTAIVVYSIGLLTTLYDHSGYGIPWFPYYPHPYMHDYHHESFVYNFGVLGILDWYSSICSLPPTKHLLILAP